MNTKHSLFISIFVALFFQAKAQIINGRDTLFGNEWIRHTQQYFKIPVAEDGIYRLSYAQLQTAGIPLSSITGNQYQLFKLGQEIPLFTSSHTLFNNTDYIEFYGQKNRGELDTHLYKGGKNDALNPEYSNFSDTAYYFLTWQNTNNAKRYITQTSTINNPPAKETWFWYTLKQSYNQALILPNLGSSVTLPAFDKGEGYGSTLNSRFTTTLIPKFFTANQSASLRTRYVTDGGSHYTTLNFNNKIILQDTTYGYNIADKTFSIQPSEITASIPFSILGNFDATDNRSISLIELTYARAFNFDNQNYFEFNIKLSESILYLEIDNFKFGTTAPILYDITNGLRITTIVENGKVKFTLPPSVSERKLILVAESVIKNATILPSINFTDFSKNTGDYICLTTNRFYEATQKYAAYRASAEGGSFKPIIIDINQLYEQFAYGIKGHPIATRSFAHYIKKNWQNPQFIVLFGKSREYHTTRKQAVDGLPTFGIPGSDVLLVANNQSDAPIIPIGRIAATTPEDVAIYLEKVKDLEANQRHLPYTAKDRNYFKNIIHLNGGAAEREIIASYMAQFNNVLGQTSLAPQVTTFKKETLDAVQFSQSDAIYNRINEGVSVITFFGHSSTGLLDFDINNPDLLKNKGKYPLFMAYGCTAGNCHQNSIGISENLVFYPLRGMAAFLGTSGNSFIHTLGTFGNTFYQNLAQKNIGKSIGELVQSSIADLNSIKDDALHSVLQEMVLNGDPAIKLHVTQGTDITPDIRSVKIEPAVLDAQLDSFKVSFDVYNLGTVANDSMTIQIKRQFPNKTPETVWQQKVIPPQYRTTYKAILPMQKDVAAGENRLFMTVDTDNAISELPLPFAENNNELVGSNGLAGIPFFVLENTIKPLFPTEFGIVSKSPITLKASTTNALAKNQTYVVEIDISENFDSPQKQRTNILQRGGVLKWQPTIQWRDSTVYYWRVSQDSTATIGYNWQNSSFIYLQKATGGGWNQSQYAQIKQNTLNKLKFSENTQSVEFGNVFNSIEFKPNFSQPHRHPFFTVNGEIGSYYWGFPTAGLQVIVFDSILNRMWRNIPIGTPEIPSIGYLRYSIPHPSGFNIASFIFDPNDSSATRGRQAFMHFLENVVPRNSYVMVYTGQANAQASYNPQNWLNDSLTYGKNIFQVLEMQGAIRVREMLSKGSVPYLFVFQKDRNNVIRERITTGYDDAILESFALIGKGQQGEMTSKLIGPAEKWQSAEIKYKLSDNNPQNDTVACSIIGVGADKKTETVIFNKIKAENIDLSNLNVAQYPYLKLVFDTKDSLSRTCAQVQHWRVFYKGLPDFAVNPNRFYKFEKDTLQVGEVFKMNVAIENTSDYAVTDSVLVQMVVTDENNKDILQTQKIPPLSIDSSQNVEFTLKTQNLEGTYRTAYEVNPKRILPEQYDFNNYIQTRFFVEKDRKNPLLDVTFDGVRIMNNDIVSSKPTIHISLRDENMVLALADTTLFKIALEYPDNIRKILFFNDPNLLFTPAKLDATGKNNKATVEYRPQFVKDGTYRLIVQARDVAGNASGNTDFSIAFKVITKAQISNVLPYPNPFSTATRFAYTLTGDTPPSYFKIQIMTVEGTIVREITQNEMGQLKIGTHLTDYVWNGTDEYGQKLANGVYLYRIIAKKADGKAFENYNTGTDQYFNKGYGKLVIMR